mmetsp:Transcript_23890/g.59509  ORF Transcript_23890/g.59509 Transcript_23890/m.59509 type:complete len:538 (-) Transcript_23890:370-1983(-)
MAMTAGIAFGLGCLVTCVFANYDATLNFRDIDSMVDQRADFCDQMSAVHNHTISLENALAGMHLSMVTPLYDPPWFDEPVNNTDPSRMTGFHAELAALLAEQAGFTYTITSHPLSAFEPDLSWTAYLDSALNKYDLSLDWWLSTDARWKKRIRTPYPFLDLSLVSGTYGAVAESSMVQRIWEITNPISPNLWIVFLIVSIITSLLYFFVERHIDGDISQTSPGSRAWCREVMDTVWTGFIQFTGGGAFSPNTISGKALALTYSLLVLLLISAYTANLAAVLVSDHKLNACQSVESCLADGHRICVRKGTVADEWMSGMHPHLERTLQIARVTTSVWEGVRNGQCDLVTQPLMLYNLATMSAEHNPDCVMTRVGDAPLQSFGGGWMSRTDYEDKCTALMIDSIGAHILALATNGKLQELLDRFYSASTSKTCPINGDGEDPLEQENLSLTVQSMSGALVIHAAGILFALSVCAGKQIRRACCRRRQRTTSGRPKEEKQPEDMTEAITSIKSDLQALRAEIGAIRDSQITQEHSNASWV